MCRIRRRLTSRCTAVPDSCSVDVPLELLALLDDLIIVRRLRHAGDEIVAERCGGMKGEQRKGGNSIALMNHVSA